MHIQFGRDYVEDPRDRKFSLQKLATQKKSKHWKLGPQLDQGYSPHCVGYAWYGLLASSPHRQKPIAPSGIYTLAQYFDEWEGQNYDGTSVRGAAKVLQITGHIEHYYWAHDIDAAITHLLENGPVVFGTNWYRDMNYPDNDGLISIGGSLLGGHAYLVYGVDVKKEIFKFQNSWGSDWGIDGTAKMSFETFETLLKKDGECCTAYESKISGDNF